MLCQLFMTDPELEGGRLVSYSGTTQAVHLPVKDSDDLASMLTDCLDLYSEYENSESHLAGVGLLGCTLGEEGKVRAFGARDLDDPSLETFVAKIDEIHGIDKFKALVCFTREPYKAPDGRFVEAVKAHVESRDGECGGLAGGRGLAPRRWTVPLFVTLG
jgi:hypothetical protein